jgi:hypothetical protein
MPFGCGPIEENTCGGEGKFHSKRFYRAIWRVKRGFRFVGEKTCTKSQHHENLQKNQSHGARLRLADAEIEAT